MSKPRVIAFIQARLTSSRLPNKVLAKIGNWTALELMLKRLERAKSLDQIVLLIPDTNQNDQLAEYCRNELSIPFFRGSEHDVLTRFVDAARIYPADYYVRLTADCPLICPEIVDEVVNLAIASKADYSSNISPPTFPDGFDVECISAAALDWSNRNIVQLSSREHVTIGIRQQASLLTDFKFVCFRRNGESLAHIRITLDNDRDLDFIGKLVANFGQSAWIATPSEIEIEAIRLSQGAYDETE